MARNRKRNKTLRPYAMAVLDDPQFYPHSFETTIEIWRLKNWSPYKMNCPDIHKQCIKLKIIQYPLSANVVFFYKMAGVDKNLRVWTFKGISPVFPSVLIFQFFSYKMTICKAPDVTHFVEEIPQRIITPI